MKSAKTLFNTLFITLSLIPIFYLVFRWKSIHGNVPLKWDSHWRPVSFGTKTELLIASMVMCGASLLSYFLMRNIHRIDPKRASSIKPSVFDKLSAGIVVFITALNLIVVVSAINPSNNVLQKMMFPLIGLMFAFLGNYMHSIKPNYFAGIRTPWALNSDENWRKTHRLAGKIWFAGGIIICLLSLFGSFDKFETIFMTIVLIMVAIPFAYSYSIFRKEQQAHNQ